MSEEKQKNEWREEIEVAGNELVDKIKELVEQGNIRRLIIRKPDGEALLEIPLTTGVVVGGAMAMMLPVLAALGALAALVARVTIEIVREGEEGEDTEQAVSSAKRKIEIDTDDE